MCSTWFLVIVANRSSPPYYYLVGRPHSRCRGYHWGATWPLPGHRPASSFLAIHGFFPVLTSMKKWFNPSKNDELNEWQVFIVHGKFIVMGHAILFFAWLTIYFTILWFNLPQVCLLHWTLAKVHVFSPQKRHLADTARSSARHDLRSTRGGLSRSTRLASNSKSFSTAVRGRRCSRRSPRRPWLRVLSMSLVVNQVLCRLRTAQSMTIIRLSSNNNMWSNHWYHVGINHRLSINFIIMSNQHITNQHEKTICIVNTFLLLTHNIY